MKNKLIAIFEDDQVNRFIYQRMINKLDCQVHIFDNPQAGIEQARSIPFDVVLIEIHFWKNFGGITILDRLKEVLPPTTSFIAMTSLLQEGDLEKVLISGFTMLVEKPVVFSKLNICSEV